MVAKKGTNDLKKIPAFFGEAICWSGGLIQDHEPCRVSCFFFTPSRAFGKGTRGNRPDGWGMNRVVWGIDR